MNKNKSLVLNLKKTRLSNYGTSAYQRLTNDWHLLHVPVELKSLWYNPESLSFVTLGNLSSKSIDSMSTYELERRIKDEELLLARLQTVFADLESKKAGK
jgi:hypothetical protein